VPLVAYAAYLLFGGRVGRRAVFVALGGYLIAAALLIVGMKAGVQLRDVIGVPLSYESAVEGMVFGFLAVLTLRSRPGLAVLSSVLCLSSVGWLYEVSFWSPIQMWVTSIRYTAPLAVNTQIISLLLLAGTLWRMGWRPGRLFAAALIVYLAFSVYLFLVYPRYLPFIFSYRRWFIRLPTYSLLASILWESRNAFRRR